MGRHSIPDPDEHEDSPESGDYAEGYRQEYGHAEGYSSEYAEDSPAESYPDHYHPGPAEQGFEAFGGLEEPPAASEHREAQPRTEYPEYPGFRAPGYEQLEEHGRPYGSEYVDYPDAGQGFADYADHDYPDTEYSNARYADTEYSDDDYTDADYPHRAGDPDYGDEYDADDREPAAFAAIDEPGSGGHRNDGEWTGTHRTIAPARRGVSRGVIIALVAVVALVAGFILWRFFGNVLHDRSNVAAGRCVEGDAKVSVLADPAIADTVSQFAQEFNKTAKPVGDHCVTIGVAPAGSDAVLAGLTGQWPANLGEKPAVWIPGSSISAARLQAAAGDKTVSASNSVASSPVLLAIRPELKPALAQQNWSTLPALQTEPDGLDKLDLAGWGNLRLALPRTGNSDAAYLAGEAVAAASAPAGSPATAGAAAIGRLTGGAPKLGSDSLDDAMKALTDASDPAAAQVHAVVTTEQQLVHRAGDVSDAKNVLASWLPPGPTAVADFPAVLLAGDWLTEEQVSAASEFERFMHKPEQVAGLVKAGFRVQGADLPTSAVTDATPVTQILSVGDDAARVALANTQSAPLPVTSPSAAGGAAVSIMLDRSLNLAPVVSALNTRIAALPPTAMVGLTTFDGGAGTTQVNVGQLGDDVDGQPRSAVLTSTLNGLSSAGGGGVSFTTLRNVLGDAQTNFRQGHTNSILVITSGPHTDQSLGSEGLQDLVRSTADPAKPVAINVINVGDDPDRATWQSVAQLSGGTYQQVPASDSPEMVAAVNQLLT